MMRGLVCPMKHSNATAKTSKRKVSECRSPQKGIKHATFIKAERVLKAIITQNTSEDVDEVVDAYEHALFAQCPHAQYTLSWRAQYVMGPLSELSLGLLQC